MQPLCVLLPGGPGMARALWRVFEMGFPNRITTAPPSHMSPLRLNSEHVQSLLRLFHDHLVGEEIQKNTLWLHPRELKELLHILDCGLMRLSALEKEEAGRCAEAVSRFINNLPLARAIPRKPANRVPRAEQALAASAP